MGKIKIFYNNHTKTTTRKILLCQQAGAEHRCYKFYLFFNCPRQSQVCQHRVWVAWARRIVQTVSVRSTSERVVARYTAAISSPEIVARSDGAAGSCFGTGWEPEASTAPVARTAPEARTTLGKRIASAAQTAAPAVCIAAAGE